MCGTVVFEDPFLIVYCSDKCKTQRMFGSVVSEDPSLIVYCSDKCKTQRMFGSVVSEDPSLIVYCPDIYKRQRMCDEAADDCLAASKLVSDWFVASETIKKLFAA